MKDTIAILLIAFGLLFGFCFRYFLVLPASEPLPNGNYGEMYGPVMYFRIPVYIFCGLCVLGGMGILVWSLFEGDSQSEIDTLQE